MNKDDELGQRIKTTLDRQQVDDATRNELRRARLAALDAADAPRRRAWMPATAVASLVLVVAAAFLFRGVEDVTLPQAAAEDLAVIASEDEFELLEEFEFYIWLEQQDQV